MSAYTHSDLEQIATAIGTAAKQVANLGTQFEAAALWFRLDKRRPRRTASSKRREKLNQVAKSARRLLKSLDEAADGPGDPEIFEALVLTGEPDANPVMEATRRIARLVEIVEGIAAGRVRSPRTEGSH